MKNKYQQNIFMTSLIGKNRLQDTDNDYVPDIWDCAPLNKKYHSTVTASKSSPTRKQQEALARTKAYGEIIAQRTGTSTAPLSPLAQQLSSDVASYSQTHDYGTLLKSQQEAVAKVEATGVTVIPSTPILTPEQQAIKNYETTSKQQISELQTAGKITPQQAALLRTYMYGDIMAYKKGQRALTRTGEYQEEIKARTLTIPRQQLLLEQPLAKKGIWDYLRGGITGTTKTFEKPIRTFLDVTTLPKQPETAQYKDLIGLWTWAKPTIKKGTEAVVAVIGYFPQKYAESKKIREQIELEYVTGSGAPMTPKQQKQVDIATQLGIFHIPKEDYTEKEIKKDFPFAATEYLTGKKASQYRIEIDEFVKQKAAELSPKIEAGQPSIYKKGDNYIYSSEEGDRKATPEEIEYYKKAESEFQEKLLKEVQPEVEKRQKELGIYGKKTEISTRWRRAVATAPITVPVYAILGFVGGAIPAVGYTATGLYTAYSLTHMPQIKQSFLESPSAFAIETGLAVTGGLIGYSLARPVPKVTLASIEKKLGYPKIDVQTIGVQQRIAPPREGLQKVVTTEAYFVTTKHLFSKEIGVAKAIGTTHFRVGTSIIASETKVLGLFSRSKGIDLITGKIIYATPIKFNVIARGIFEPKDLMLPITGKYGIHKYTVSKEFPGSRGYVMSKSVAGKDLWAATLKEGKLTKSKTVGAVNIYELSDTTFFFRGMTKIPKKPVIKAGIFQYEKWGAGNIVGLIFKELITPDETRTGGLFIHATKPTTKAWDYGTTTKPSAISGTITKISTKALSEEAATTGIAATAKISALASQVTATKIYPSFVFSVPVTKKIDVKTLSYKMPTLAVEKTRIEPIVRLAPPQPIVTTAQRSAIATLVIPRVIPKEIAKEKPLLKPPIITTPILTTPVFNIPGFILFPGGFIKPKFPDERIYGKKQIYERGYKYSPTLTGVILRRTIKIAPSPKKVWGGFEIRPIALSPYKAPTKTKTKKTKKKNIFGL